MISVELDFINPYPTASTDIYATTGEMVTINKNVAANSFFIRCCSVFYDLLHNEWVLSSEICFKFIEKASGLQ